MWCPGSRWKSLTIKAGETLQRRRGDSQVMVQSCAGDAFQAVPSTGLEDAFWGGSHFYPKPRGSAEEQPHQRAASALRPTSLAGRRGASCPSAPAASLIVQKEQPSKDSLLLKAKCQSLALTQPFSNSIKL